MRALILLCVALWWPARFSLQQYGCISYPFKAEIAAADNFGNFYVAGKNRVHKYAPDGRYLFPYEEFRFGRIGNVDATNPLKLLVYFPDFSTVVFLDRFLSPLSTLNFFQLGYQNITAVASSVDGNVWFYDNVNFKLKKMDESGRVIRESQPLHLLLQQTPYPNFMVEQDNQVYVNDPQIGIMVFDFYGSYGKTIPLKGLRKFQIFQGKIIYLEDGKLKSYRPGTFESGEIPLPDTSQITAALVTKQKLMVLKPDSLLFCSY
ncbi:MAG: hypothetical protein NZM35_07825 [Chitinophagales bacterium]|nr:hypothetical protein [Chitinophagales bacterium]MDW8419665.1 hypothetical protein [Chitinophagales bacterium]